MRTSANSLTKIAVQKFKQNKLGLLSFYYILFCGCVAVFCYVLSPDSSSNANQMHLEIHSKKPGFKATLLHIPTNKKQSVFSFLMYGQLHPAIEIPITNYRIEGKKTDGNNVG